MPDLGYGHNCGMGKYYVPGCEGCRSIGREASRRRRATPDGREKMRESVRRSARRSRSTPEGREKHRKTCREYMRLRLSTPEGREKQREIARRHLATPHGREKARESSRRWGKRDGNAVAKDARRREREAGRVWVDERAPSGEKVCAVCGDPIDEALTRPDPMSLTLGHEPPVCRVEVVGDGVWRDEHLGCNLSKGRRLDAEL